MNAPPRRKLLEKRELSMPRTLEPYQMIERSIIKKYRDELWKPFVYAVKKYELIQAGDKIAVCISGGKDSMLMAKLMQELQPPQRMCRLSWCSLSWIRATTPSTASASRATRRCCDIPITDIRDQYLRGGQQHGQIALLPLRPHATRPPLQHRPRSSAATRSRWVITLTM